MKLQALILGENGLFKAIGQLFHPLFVLVATVLSGIYAVVPSYAVAIIILTVVIMALLTPLTVKSIRSMIAMQVLQPEMQKLRQKYKGPENREQLNQELMKVYKDAGVSPVGGCLPMFLQMPFLFVLYDILRAMANTVKKGQLVSWTGKKCLVTKCANPSYIPVHSKLHANIVAHPGVLNSFGINLALKPLSSHHGFVGYLPYLAIVGVAIALQYGQMAQMMKRSNKMGNAVSSQQQMMQKFMPLLMAYIYFIVPTGAVLYMVVSSAIRIGTQDIIFRSGIVKLPGSGGAREIGGSSSPVLDAKSKVLEDGNPPENEPKASNGKGVQKQTPFQKSNGKLNPKQVVPDPKDLQNKPHPRAKGKRARKAR